MSLGPLLIGTMERVFLPVRTPRTPPEVIGATELPLLDSDNHRPHGGQAPVGVPPQDAGAEEKRREAT